MYLITTLGIILFNALSFRVPWFYRDLTQLASMESWTPRGFSENLSSMPSTVHDCLFKSTILWSGFWFCSTWENYSVLREGRPLFTVSTVVAVNEHIGVMVNESWFKGYALFKKKKPSCECVGPSICRGLSHVTKLVIKLGHRHWSYWQTLAQWSLRLSCDLLNWFYLILYNTNDLKHYFLN